jgi:phosphate transport system substrate-binding protein
MKATEENLMRRPSGTAAIEAIDRSLWIWMGMTIATLMLVLTSAAHATPTGRIVVAGYGPELPVLQDLAGAFEKRTPGAAVDFKWDKTVRAVELVKSGEAHIAVTDQPDAALSHTQIAWDGIAVVVNFANPVKELTTTQVRALLTGQITRWSDLDGANKTVELFSRPPQANVSTGLELSLGVPGKLAGKGRPIRTDQQALSAVSGNDSAITYLSLQTALKAQEDGIPIRVLTIDQVEPGEPTVTNGRYKLRRPVLLLAAPNPDPLTGAFLAFATSPEGQQIVRAMFAPATEAASPLKVQRIGSAVPQS